MQTHKKIERAPSELSLAYKKLWKKHERKIVSKVVPAVLDAAGDVLASFQFIIQCKYSDDFDKNIKNIKKIHYICTKRRGIRDKYL